MALTLIYKDLSSSCSPLLFGVGVGVGVVVVVVAVVFCCCW